MRYIGHLLTTNWTKICRVLIFVLIHLIQTGPSPIGVYQPTSAALKQSLDYYQALKTIYSSQKPLNLSLTLEQLLPYPLSEKTFNSIEK